MINQSLPHVTALTMCSTIILSSPSAYLLPCTHRAVLEANFSHRVLSPPTTALAPQTLRLD